MKDSTTKNPSGILDAFRRNGRLKQVLTLFLIVGILAQTSLASPLVFKASKNISSKEFVELGSFDASKFRQIRINVRILTLSGSIPVSKESAERELALATSQFERTEKLYKDGAYSKGDFVSAEDRLRQARESVENAFSAEMVGVVDSDEIQVLSINESNLRTSIVMDAPPATVRVKVRGKGSFSIYVWGQ